MNDVEVITGARLHFGLICGAPQSTSRFGGIGLMLRDPGWRLSVRSSPNIACVADSQEVRKRLVSLTPILCDRHGLSGLHVSVQRGIALHHGLGAGTQLALALAAAAGIIAGEPRPADSMLLATQLQRSRRSAIGTFGFDRGGLIVDRGESDPHATRLLTRHDIPNDWRIVLLTPIGQTGLSGVQEESVFRQQHFMSQDLVTKQTSLIHEQILPAANAGDFERFNNSLAQFGTNAGTFFAAQQGGVYSSEVIRELAASNEFNDLQPVQSSWGPSVAVFAPTEEHAHGVCERIERSNFASRMTCQVTQALACGATIRTAAPEVPDHVVRG